MSDDPVWVYDPTDRYFVAFRAGYLARQHEHGDTTEKTDRRLWDEYVTWRLHP